MKINRDEFLSFYKESNFLRYSQFYFERDILRIASRMFLAEMELKTKGKISKISIPISTQTYKRIDKDRLKGILTDLFLLILLERIEINIFEIDDWKGRVFKKGDEQGECDAVILFSGGLDSYAGMRISELNFKKLQGVFVAHNDQVRIIQIVNRIKPEVKSVIRTIYAPPMGSSGYSQLRGFLYILSGAVYLNLSKTNKIIVTECGPTMYQTLFSPYDSITYTTHPYVLTAAKECLQVLLGYEPQIIIPFENLTKAEIVAESGIEDFERLHSCISQRFGDHDGTCFGCVIRRLACIVNGVKDVKYNQDIFKDEVNQDNLLNLLQYSEDIINSYDRMPSFQKEKIEEFNKYDLFRRFALDNLAGLMMGVSEKHYLYKKYIKLKERLLERRLDEIWAKKIKADYKKIIK